MNRRRFFLGTVALLSVPAGTAAAPLRARMYKTPQCGCCEDYAAYLRKNGFEVDVELSNDLSAISRKAGVPENLQGCHTLFLDGYVVDGHVPVSAIRKLLAERPRVAGITLPGMPGGSPGMTGQKTEPFTIFAVFKDSTSPKVYAVE